VTMVNQASIVEALWTLGIELVIAAAVWAYHRERTVARADCYRTFWPRFWAESVDALVLWPLTLGSAIAASGGASNEVAVIASGVVSAATFIYTAVMHGRYGQTVGKMAVRVKVLDARTGNPISWRQAFIRESIPLAMTLALLAFLVAGPSADVLAVDVAADSLPAFSLGEWLLLTLPMLWFVAEVVTMLTNAKRRALHDFIAGTVVVRTNTRP
jgi:uncharacterized RDD family membrane protein YckC